LPLRFGRIDHFSKMTCGPKDAKLSLYDLKSDPREIHGRVLTSSDATYEADTSELKKWFSRTETRAAEQKLTPHDEEVLKSLGYVQ
jgi:hypothetical protein